MPIKTEITPEYRSLLETLITSNHILHHHGLVDAFGHISIRHPHNPSLYIIPSYIAPALVRSPNDLIEYHISDSSPLDPNAPKGYSERFIHSELYKRFPALTSITHSHSPPILSFLASRTPLRPATHMAGFLGENGPPVFDITGTPTYQAGHRKDMLVNTTELGAALARCFDEEGEGGDGGPRNVVVLMRHHGFTAVGGTIRDAVFRAMYTQANARVCIDAAGLRAAAGGSAGERKGLDDEVGLDFLTEEEARGCREMNEGTADKAWRMWVREVEGGGLYGNEIRDGGWVEGEGVDVKGVGGEQGVTTHSMH